MANILITIINTSIAAIPIILIAFILRFLLRILPKKYSSLMWCVVFIRLIIPYGINSESFLYFLQNKKINNLIIKTDYIPHNIGAMLQYLNVDFNNISLMTLFFTILFTIWFIGFLSISIYEVTTYVKTSKKLATAIKIKDCVYETNQIVTPFLFGLLYPRIYVPFGTSSHELAFILCHEYTHMKRKDYLLKILFYLILTIHWFNPFVWLAFKYMSIDMEMSCDEKVILIMGNHKRKEYAETIFRFSNAVNVPTNSILTFGASNTHVRVKHLLKNKKNNKITIIIATLLCTILAVGLITNSMIGSTFNYIKNQIRINQVKHLESTDLSNILINTLQLGLNINDIDLTTYQQSDRFSGGNHSHYYEQLVLDVDEDNKISYIFGFNSEVSVKINDRTAVSIEDISLLLGNHYLNKTEDGEQQLRKYIYYDNNTSIVAEFIYSSATKDFVWIKTWKLD